MSTSDITKVGLPTNSIGVFPITAKKDNQLFKFHGYCLSEQNIARVIKLTSDVDHTSFVISYDYYESNEANCKHLVTFVMLGYYFECYVPDDAAAWDNVYASVTLYTHTDGERAITPYTSSSDEETSVVTLTNYDNSDPEVSGCLHLLKKDKGEYTIPTSSQERYDFKSLDTTDTFLVCGDSSVFQ